MASVLFTPEVDDLVKKCTERFHIPGLAISICQGGSTLSKAYGLAQLDPPVKTTTSTLFYVCSTTKAQLCAVWQIYIDSDANQNKPDSERISWSTPLSTIIRDDFVLADDRTNQVTLEDAVSHRGGMPGHDASYGRDGVRTVKEVTRNLRHLPVGAPLRTEFDYCNLLYIAACHALETITGKTLAQVLRESLWSPLGMHHTYAGNKEATQAKDEVIANTYTWSETIGSNTDKNGKYLKETLEGLDTASGAGYVISSADDWAKWMNCVLSPSTEGVLNEQQVKDLFKSRSIEAPDNSGSYNVPFDGILTYACGWWVTFYRGHQVYYHSGAAQGAGAFTMIVPSLRWGVTFLGNGTWLATTLVGLAVELLDIALDVPQQQRFGREKAESAALAFFKNADEAFKTSLERLYPDLPDSRLHLTLPIERYAGTYSDAGYGQLTFDVRKDVDGKDCLFCDLTGKRTFPGTLVLQHVNAEFWVLTQTFAQTTMRSARRAQSEIGVDGKVKAFGLAVIGTLPEHLVRFVREA